MDIRIGHGYDVHRLKSGRRCILCGVEIPGGFGPDGYSDADAPLHALMDALLGAMALGDIGKYFPDSDENWRMADSIELLKSVYEMILANGYTLGNADITIILQSPRLAPYIEQMRGTVAAALETEPERISVKATTEEKLGFTGAGEGISAVAVVLLMSK